ncbi:MAG: SPW repeat domain-containing protein [Vicinamibacterales bacterium]
MRLESKIHVALGAWLIAAPWVLHYSNSNAHANEVIFGIAVMVAAVWSGYSTAAVSGAFVVQLGLAAWIFLAPFTFHYAGAVAPLPEAVDMLTALLIGLVAVVAMAGRLPEGPAGRLPG